MLPRLLEFLPPLLEGTLVTLRITAAAAVLAAVMAFAAGLARLSPWAPVRWVAVTYVEFFRGTALLVQLFWLFFALPLLGVELSAFTAAVLGLGLNIGAYGSEVVRGAVLAMPPGQFEATVAVNMSRWQALRLVILPQAVVGMMPPFCNLLIELLKGTALVSLITLSDLTFRAQILRNNTMATMEIFVPVLVLYFLIAQVIAAGMRLLERRLTRGLDYGGLGR